MVIRGMLKLSYGRLGTVLVICFGWSLLLAGADRQITDPVEVKALRSIRRSLIDPKNHLARWSRGDPCTSDWTGVICHNRTLSDGYLHVRHLFLLNMNLSGTLSPELGRLSRLVILNFMWNSISGSIPREIGNITTLELLLLSGNNLSGSLPHELGNLSNLDRIQIDQNHISGHIPPSFVNMTAVKHFHMNNNSLSGQIPPEISQLPNLVHILLDNNNLSGYLPPELSEMPILVILQLDNNNFSGSTIPSSYGNITHLSKLSLRNCGLQGPIPRWRNWPNVSYIDLSMNQLSGSIPTETLSEMITTLDVSNNNLNGTLPASFSRLPRLQRLSVANNSLTGSIPAVLWQNRTLNSTERLFMDFGYNMFENVSGSFSISPNVTIGFQGNPVCVINNLLTPYCRANEVKFDNNVNVSSFDDCLPVTCQTDYENAPATPFACVCSAPLYIEYRMKSPGFSDFTPYSNLFMDYLSSGLEMNVYQVEIDSAAWEKGPRLRMKLKLFPPYVNDSTVHQFNRSQVYWIIDMFGGWNIPRSQLFGPFELLNFTLTDTYREALNWPSSRSISKGSSVGIILGVIAGLLAFLAVIFLIFLTAYIRKQRASSKSSTPKKISVKVVGVKDFTYEEMATATNGFTSSSMVGEGGYGKVYRGILANGTVVAIKRAQEGSLQGEREFLTEIELLSRLHHRNLVSLIGYCDEEGKQMLVYEFMPNGTLRENLSGKCKASLNFAMRVKLAIASAKGILYLHTEADPLIFHRDIKASNILLDSNYTAKVADFGLSRLAPVPVLEGEDVPSHVSTAVKGTPGYLDPEYFLTRKLTDKSDVYSLGVVFLELLTGRHPIQHGKNIVREVNSAHSMGIIFSVVDEQMGSYPSKCLEKFIELALNCCQDETDSRPSMAEVVRELENIWSMMPDHSTKLTELSATDPGKLTPSSSSSTSFSHMKNMHGSQDVSGNDLVSGVIPTVSPR